MIRKEQGFTLIELIITMVIFVFVMIAASQIFTGLLTQFKQQSRIAETNIEGIVGIDIMRRDIEHAGYGLPWVWTHGVSGEAVNDAKTPQDDTAYNDTAANVLPRALVSGDGAGSGGSDVLVVKALNVATNAAASKWTYLFKGNKVTEWTPANENFLANDRLIVMSAATRTLIVSSGGSFTTRYVTTTTPDSVLEPVANDFAPTDSNEVRVVYGVTSAASPDVTAALGMPFNRADYYVRTAAAIPARCATGTGTLYKATVDQSAGGLTEYPLLDCVADMQVVYARDNDGNGSFTKGSGTPPDAYSDDISDLTTAEQVRNTVWEVDVYILAHEGQRDPNFTFNNWTGSSTCATCIRVGQSTSLGSLYVGRDMDISGIPNYLNYRWKVYTIAVRPTNLR